MEDEKFSDTALKSYFLSGCTTNMAETINQDCCKNSSVSEILNSEHYWEKNRSEETRKRGNWEDEDIR